MAHTDSSGSARPLAPDPTLPDPTRPDPTRVFTAVELCEQLNRLRSRGTDGRPRHRVSLTELSRLTGIPRSTVHTYLSGGTLPSAEALDAIVLALGCGAGPARRWAEAWCRVTEGCRGSELRSRSAGWSKFASLDHEVRKAMRRVTDRWYDLSRPTAIAERVFLGADRRIAHADFRLTVRALEDGVDRWALRLPPGPSVRDPRDVEIVDTQNCVAGTHRFVEGPRVRVFELLLGGKLLAGETHQLEFRLDYGGAARARTLRSDDARDRCVDVMRGFRRQGPTYSLEVCFGAHQHPRGIRQIQLHAADAPENTVRTLRLNAWRRVGISLESPVAGLHGIRWSWPDD
jgi:transcriptional regulator with XRE-family HTH domain